ncbi:50S ribosomal protein L1, partial [Candidatus Saccharibacteria bacterium]|nr:50S ribosomal protein L1 [Candidatus Saccharibacteria bacterium]
LYTVSEAVELLPKLSKTKFDATAEVHIVLDIDPKQSDQNLRTSAALPAGSGKTVKVAVITSDKEADAAKKAGADNTDAAAILADIAKGKLDFDVLIASPDKMSELGRHAKVLGPKGLMPSPKSGTVTNNPAAMVEEIKKGRAEIKNDPSGIVHVAFGKLSFKAADLEANLRAVLGAVRTNKPAGVKGIYVKTIYITSSMSPSIKLDTTELQKSSKE